MDLTVERNKIKEAISQINNPELLNSIKELINSNLTEDNDSMIESIKRGLEDVEQGKVTPHDTVRKKYEKWL